MFSDCAVGVLTHSDSALSTHRGNGSQRYVTWPEDKRLTSTYRAASHLGPPTGTDVGPFFSFKILDVFFGLCFTQLEKLEA